MKHSYKIYNLYKKSSVLVVNVPNSPISGFSIGVRAGYNYAPKEKQEIAHLLEHVMFEGNKKYPNVDIFSYEIEKNGIYQNGHTGPIYIDFEYSFIKDFTKEAIALALCQLKGPLFNDVVAKKEINIIKSELEPLVDDPYELCSENLRKIIYDNSFTTKNRLKSLNNIRTQDIKNYYKKHFNLNNTKFLLYGDYSEAEVNKLIDFLKKNLQDYPEGKKQALRYKPLKKYNKKIVAVNSKAVRRNCFDLSFVNPGYPIKISPEIKIFHTIYNDGTYSRIFRKIRSNGVAYGLSSGYSIGKNFSEFYLYNKSSATDSNKIFKIALKELVDILAGNITKEEFDRAKSYALSKIQRSHARSSDLASWYVSDFADEDPLIDFNDYKKRLKEATLEETIKAANDFIIKDGWALSLIGPDIQKRSMNYESILKTLDKVTTDTK